MWLGFHVVTNLLRLLLTTAARWSLFFHYKALWFSASQSLLIDLQLTVFSDKHQPLQLVYAFSICSHNKYLYQIWNPRLSVYDRLAYINMSQINGWLILFKISGRAGLQVFTGNHTQCKITLIHLCQLYLADLFYTRLYFCFYLMAVAASWLCMFHLFDKMCVLDLD